MNQVEFSRLIYHYIGIRCRAHLSSVLGRVYLSYLVELFTHHN